MPSYAVDNILSILLVWEANQLPCALLLHSTVPIYIASNNPPFLQFNNVIESRTKYICSLYPSQLHHKYLMMIETIFFLIR